MDSRKHGRPVNSKMTGNTLLMAENRQLKAELASVKKELMQSAQLYSRSNEQCIELVEEVQRLNDILSKVHHLTSRVTIQNGTSAGMAYKNGEERERSMQSESVAGGRLWKYLKGNDDFGGHQGTRPYPDVDTSDARTQPYLSTSREITVSRSIVADKNTKSTLEEAEHILVKDEEEWFLQQSTDIAMDFDGENDWIYETLDEMTPVELLFEGDTKKDVFAQINPAGFDGVRNQIQNATLSSMKRKYKSETANDLNDPPRERSFECYICKKTFTLKRNLLCYFRNHTGTGLLYCGYQSCGKSFTSQSILALHTRIHTGEKPFQCEFPGCEKKFAHNTNLTRHRRLHAGEKPHVCRWTGCTACFRQRHQLTAHIRRLHQETGVK